MKNLETIAYTLDSPRTDKRILKLEFTQKNSFDAIWKNAKTFSGQVSSKMAQNYHILSDKLSQKGYLKQDENK